MVFPFTYQSHGKSWRLTDLYDISLLVNQSEAMLNEGMKYTYNKEENEKKPQQWKWRIVGKGKILPYIIPCRRPLQCYHACIETVCWVNLNNEKCAAKMGCHIFIFSLICFKHQQVGGWFSSRAVRVGISVFNAQNSHNYVYK